MFEWMRYGFGNLMHVTQNHPPSCHPASTQLNKAATVFKCISCQRPFLCTFIYLLSFCRFTFLIMKIIGPECVSAPEVSLSLWIITTTNNFQIGCQDKWIHLAMENRTEWTAKREYMHPMRRNALFHLSTFAHLWLLRKLKINLNSVTSSIEIRTKQTKTMFE